MNDMRYVQDLELQGRELRVRGRCFMFLKRLVRSSSGANVKAWRPALMSQQSEAVEDASFEREAVLSHFKTAHMTESY